MTELLTEKSKIDSIMTTNLLKFKFNKGVPSAVL